MKFNTGHGHGGGGGHGGGHGHDEQPQVIKIVKVSGKLYIFLVILFKRNINFKF